MKIKCNLHIGRPQGGNRPEVMTVEVTDTVSRIQFLNLEGPPRTREEMAADARALDAVAPTPEEKFALMFSASNDDDLDEPLPPKQCGLDDPECESCQ